MNESFETVMEYGDKEKNSKSGQMSSAILMLNKLVWGFDFSQCHAFEEINTLSFDIIGKTTIS